MGQQKQTNQIIFEDPIILRLSIRFEESNSGKMTFMEFKVL